MSHRHVDGVGLPADQDGVRLQVPALAIQAFKCRHSELALLSVAVKGHLNARVKASAFLFLVLREHPFDGQPAGFPLLTGHQLVQPSNQRGGRSDLRDGRVRGGDALRTSERLF